MSNYLVKWEIDIEADSPEEASAIACSIQRDPESTATWFEIDEKLYCVDTESDDWKAWESFNASDAGRVAEGLLKKLVGDGGLLWHLYSDASVGPHDDLPSHCDLTTDCAIDLSDEENELLGRLLGRA